MAGVFADDADDAFAADDAAGLAELLDGWADFHGDVGRGVEGDWPIRCAEI